MHNKENHNRPQGVMGLTSLSLGLCLRVMQSE